MEIKVGDTVTYLGAKSNRWGDTLEGESRGFLVVGQKYIVESILSNITVGDSVRLKIRNGITWGLDKECVGLVSKKAKIRNLPEWF